MKKLIRLVIAIFIVTTTIIYANNYKTDCANYVEKMQGSPEGQYYELSTYKSAHVSVFVSNGSLVPSGIYADVYTPGVGSESFGPYSSIDEAFTQGLIYQYNAVQTNDEKITVAQALKYDCGYDISQLNTSQTTTEEPATEQPSADETTQDNTTSTDNSTSSQSSDASTKDNKSESTTSGSGTAESETAEDASSETANEEEWIEIDRIEPTCTKEGTITYQSSATGETKTETIDKINHTPGEQQTIVEPSLFSTGVAVIRCTECDEVLEEITLPATFPTWGFVVIGVILVGVVAGVVILLRKAK